MLHFCVDLFRHISGCLNYQCLFLTAFNSFLGLFNAVKCIEMPIVSGNGIAKNMHEWEVCMKIICTVHILYRLLESISDFLHACQKHIILYASE